MIWIVSAVLFSVIMFVLYSCVVAGARADRRMSEIMKKIGKK